MTLQYPAHSNVHLGPVDEFATRDLVDPDLYLLAETGGLREHPCDGLAEAAPLCLGLPTIQ